MKKTTAILVLLAFLVSLFTLNAQNESVQNDTYISTVGTIYYVDSVNGNDTNSGTSESQAWKSLFKINESTFLPGDVILLKRDSVFNWEHLWLKSSGTKENPIIVSAYGEGEKPQILSVNDPEFSGSFEVPTEDAAIYACNQNYVTYDNLYIRNLTPSTGEQYGVYFGGNYSNGRVFSEGLVIQNCTVFGSSDLYWNTFSHKLYNGIFVYAYIESVTIKNNDIYNCKGNGITVNGMVSGTNRNGVVNALSGKNVLVEGNYMSNIGADGILILNSQYPITQYNVVNNSHSYSKAAEVAIWPFSCYGALFQYNEAYNTQTIYDGQGYDSDYQCYNTTFQYNYSHNNTGGFMLVCNEITNWDGGYSYNRNTVIRYNISENDYQYLFTFSGVTENTSVYNNTFYSSWGISGNTIFAYSKGTNTLTGKQYSDDIKFLNNIFYLNNSMATFDWKKITNVQWKNNLTYATHNNQPANGLVNNTADAGKYICSACNNAFAKETFTQTQTGYICSDCGQECTISEVVVNQFTSSGNITYTDPKLHNPGGANTGIENCVAYKLYSDSPAIGAGITVDETNMLYKSTTDFFGNPITSTVNIGAYQGAGEGISADVPTIDNGRYRVIADFENASANATNSKIEPITYSSTWNSTTSINQDSTYLDTQYSSTKSIKLVNKDTAQREVNFYLHTRGKFEDSYGLSFYAHGNGTSRSAYIQVGIYKYNFSIPANGGRINIRWDSTCYNTSTYKNELGNSQNIVNVSTLNVAFTLPVAATVYFDQFMADLFADQEIPTTTIPTTTTDNTVKPYPLVEGFEVARTIDTFDTWTGVEGLSYLTNGTNSNSYNLNSFYCSKSVDTYQKTDGTRYAGVPLGTLNSNDATAIRFWYKSSASFNIQLRNSNYGQPSIDYSITIPANSSGTWYTIDFNTITNAGKNIASLKFLFVKTSGTYIDEIHTLKTATILYGDANNDNIINAKDVLSIRKEIAGYQSDINIVNSDAYYDSNINAKDILMVRKYLAYEGIVLGPKDSN